MDLLGLKDKEVKQFIENIPLPFAKAEIIFNGQNEPEDLRIDEINGLFEEVANIKKELMQGQLLSTFSPDFNKVFNKDRIPVLDAWQDKLQYKFDLFISSRDQWFDVFVTQFDKSKVCLIISDSSAHHNKLDELKYKGEKFRELYEHATVGIYRANPEGEIVMANQALLRTLGYDSFDEYRNKKLYDKRFTINLADDLKNILASKGEVHGFESSWQTKSGDAIYVMESARIVKGERGELEYYEGSVEDISDKKIAETQIKQLNDIFVELGIDPLKNINTIVKKTNEILNGFCVFYINHLEENHQLVTLASYNAPEGFDIDEVPEGHICFEATMKSKESPIIINDLEQTDYFFTDPNIKNFNIKAYLGHPVQIIGNSSGSLCVFDIKKREFTETELKIIGTLAVALAIEHNRLNLENELKAASLMAENANKAKSQFLANMSHEIRTPLNGIMGFSEILINQETDKRKYQMLKLIEESGQQLFRIVNDIFDYSMIEAGKITLKETYFSPKDIVIETVDYFSASAKEKGLTVVVDDKDVQSEKLFGDYVKLNQILANVISNAIKFTEEGSVLIITSTKQTGDKTEFKITVEDSGIGIDPEQLENIFIEFEQIENYLTKRIKGTGLGLAITKRLTDFLNGQITVESEPGKGSRFIIQIPFLTQTNQKTELIMENHIEKRENESREVKILLAEDNEANQFLIKAITKSQNWDITVVDDGEQAVDAYKTNDYDLVLMDVQMPSMNGYEATKEIREFEKESGKHTPIIALTAYAMKSDKNLCLEAGMDDYISKPFKRQQFLDAITDTLNKFSV
ncbi:MAG: response regulator [Bacteroidales bacterium]|nr:response regulator [Bacteroidales bacterium]